MTSIAPYPRHLGFYISFTVVFIWLFIKLYPHHECFYTFISSLFNTYCISPLSSSSIDFISSLFNLIIGLYVSFIIIVIRMFLFCLFRYGLIVCDPLSSLIWSFVILYNRLTSIVYHPYSSIYWQYAVLYCQYELIVYLPLSSNVWLYVILLYRYLMIFYHPQLSVI